VLSSVFQGDTDNYGKVVLLPLLLLVYSPWRVATIYKPPRGCVNILLQAQHTTHAFISLLHCYLYLLCHCTL